MSIGIALFKFFKKEKPKPIKPFIEIQRYRCPFYGFGRIANVFMDSCGSQCALIVNSHESCKMEMNDQIPDWNQCPLNSEENKKRVEKIIKSSLIFPEEFQPYDQPSWDGLSFKEWMGYVMNEEVKNSGKGV